MLNLGSRAFGWAVKVHANAAGLIVYVNVGRCDVIMTSGHLACSGFGACRSETILLTRDTVAGTVYYVMLALLAVPLLVARQ